VTYYDNSLPLNQALPHQFSTENARPWRIALLLSLLLSNQLGFITGTVFGNSTARYLPPLLIMATALFTLKPTARNRTRTCSQFLFSIYVILGLATASTIVVIAQSNFSSVSIRPITKLAGMFVTFPAILKCAKTLNKTEIISALRLFCVFEIALLWANPGDVVWNVNVLSMRASTAALIGFCTYNNFIIRCFFLAMALVFPITNFCRTGAISTAASSLSYRFFTSNSQNRQAYVLFSLAIFLFLTVLVWTANNSLAVNITKHQTEEGAISNFFFHDKRKKDSTLLDREDQWKLAAEAIAENPMFGVGLSNELLLFGKRAHNSFISAAVECGIPYALVWLALSFQILLVALKQPPPVKNDERSRIAGALWILIIYFLLSSIVSTSGLGSIFTPTSQVCYLLASWLLMNPSSQNY